MISSASGMTELDLVHGWPAAPNIRVRQALPADLTAVGELAAVAGVRLEKQLASAVTTGIAGAALRAGLRSGKEVFGRHIAEQFVAHPDDPMPAYLSAARLDRAGVLVRQRFSTKTPRCTGRRGRRWHGHCYRHHLVPTPPLTGCRTNEHDVDRLQQFRQLPP